MANGPLAIRIGTSLFPTQMNAGKHSPRASRNHILKKRQFRPNANFHNASDYRLPEIIGDNSHEQEASSC